jgi:hypothetical protein
MDDAAAQAHGEYAKTAFQLSVSQQQVQELQARHQQEIADRDARDGQERLLSEMRDMARDLGLDPANPLLDYGEVSQDAASRMARLRRSIPEVRAAMATATANAPAEPLQAPDHSAEAIDTTGSTSAPAGDAERKKQTYLDAYSAYQTGLRVFSALDLKRLRDEAVAAGAEF